MRTILWERASEVFHAFEGHRGGTYKLCPTLPEAVPRLVMEIAGQRVCLLCMRRAIEMAG